MTRLRAADNTRAKRRGVGAALPDVVRRLRG